MVEVFHVVYKMSNIVQLALTIVFDQLPRLQHRGLAEYTIMFLPAREKARKPNLFLQYLRGNRIRRNLLREQQPVLLLLCG